MVDTVFTIGFTQKSAPVFFEALREAGVTRLLDVRVQNRSQLAGFTKQGDLPYLLEQILGVSYTHEPQLAPTTELMRDYRAERLDFDAFAAQYVALLAERAVESALEPAILDASTVLLCSEAEPDHCHRRLALEYLERHWGRREVVHL